MWTSYNQGYKMGCKNHIQDYCVFLCYFTECICSFDKKENPNWEQIVEKYKKIVHMM